MMSALPGTESQLNPEAIPDLRAASGLQTKSASTLLGYNGGGKGERHYMTMDLLGGHRLKPLSSADGAEMWAVLT